MGWTLSASLIKLKFEHLSNDATKLGDLEVASGDLADVAKKHIAHEFSVECYVINWKLLWS